MPPVRQVPPNVNDPNLRGFLNELRNAIGKLGDQVTKVASDITSIGGGGGGGGNPNPNPNPNPPPEPVGDGLPPPAPLSLEAVPGAFSITLVWTNPVIPDLAATEVWARRSFPAWNATFSYLANAKVLVGDTVYRSRKAQDVNSQTNVVTQNKGFAPATHPDWWEQTTLAPTEKSYIGESAGNSWIHDNLTPGETWAYWVRNRDIENLFSTYFPPDDVGVITTTLLDPGAYLDLLTNSITATQLYSDLGRRINLIDGPLTIQPSCSIPGHATQAACVAAGGTWNPGSVAYRVAEEASARAAGLAAEALARSTGISNEATIRSTQDEQLAQTISVVNAKADNAAAAVISEQTARVNADGALGQRIDAVVATTNGNTAAITSEATARATADSALSTRIDTVVATTNNNTAAIQTETTARTTADGALSQRIDTVVAKADSNAAALTSEATARANADGALGQRIDQVQAVGNNNSALITDINQSKIGYCKIGGLASDQTTRQSCEAAGGTWNVGLPVATAVKQVSVTTAGMCFRNGVQSGEITQIACEAEIGGVKGVWVPPQTGALEQQFLAQQRVNGQLYSQYTVKIDNSGWIAGFGLASEDQGDGTFMSDFGVRADRFWIAAPQTPRSELNGITLANLDSNGTVVRLVTDSGHISGFSQPLRAQLNLTVAPSVTIKQGEWITLKDVRNQNRDTSHNQYNESWQVYYISGNYIEFLVPAAWYGNGFSSNQTAPPNNDPPRAVPGNRLPFIVTTTPRQYNDVTIPAGVFMNTAFIVDASITNAKIFGHICSADYNGSTSAPQTTPGTVGWCINKNGQAVFNSGVWRNYLRSQTFNGTFNSGGIITSFGTAGWAMDQNGTAVFNDVIVRNPGRNITNGILAKADGAYWTSIPRNQPSPAPYWTDNNQTYGIANWTYDCLIPTDKEATYTVTLSMQCQIYLRYALVRAYHKNGTAEFVIYDDAVGSSGGDLNARHVSGTTTGIMAARSNGTIYFEIAIRVASGGTQPFSNIRLSVQEMYR